MDEIAPATQQAILGRHVVSLTDNADSQLDLLARSFSAGLQSEHRCLFIADRTPPEVFAAAMAARGCDIAPGVASGQFRIASSADTYLRGGYFDAERMRDLIAEAVASGSTDGFAGLCVAGEVTWLSRRVPGVDRVLEYEYSVNDLPGRASACIICVYDPRGLPAWIGPELAKIHPELHVNGSVVESRTHNAGPPRPEDIPLVEELEPVAEGLPCARLAELISAYADGELAARRRAEIAAHLAGCPECANLLASYERLKADLGAVRRTPRHDPERFLTQLRRRIGDPADAN